MTQQRSSGLPLPFCLLEPLRRGDRLNDRALRSASGQVIVSPVAPAFTLTALAVSHVDLTLPPHSVAAITIEGAVASDGDRPQ